VLEYVADAHDPVDRRIVLMVLAAEETPVAIGSRYEKNRPHTFEHVNANIRLLVKVHLMVHSTLAGPTLLESLGLFAGCKFDT
jgi:hypothetical protein